MDVQDLVSPLEIVPPSPLCEVMVLFRLHGLYGTRTLSPGMFVLVPPLVSKVFFLLVMRLPVYCWCVCVRRGVNHVTQRRRNKLA